MTFLCFVFFSFLLFYILFCFKCSVCAPSLSPHARNPQQPAHFVHCFCVGFCFELYSAAHSHHDVGARGTCMHDEVIQFEESLNFLDGEMLLCFFESFAGFPGASTSSSISSFARFSPRPRVSRLTCTSSSSAAPPP